MATIYQKKGSGKWYLNYTIEGRRRRVCVGTSEKQARRQLEELKAKITLGQLEGLPDPIQDIVPATYFTAFVEYLQAHYPRRTAQRYIEIVGHFRQFCAERRFPSLRAVKTRHIAEYERRRSRYVVPVTIRQEFTVLRLLFERARQLGYVNDTPVTIKPPPAQKPKEARFLTKKEISKLLTASSKFDQVLWQTLIMTGMRVGELTHLEWCDVDYRRKKLTVRHREEFATKTRESRSIPLHPTLAQLLKTLPKRSTHYVFTSVTGGQLTHVYRRFQKCARKASIEGATPHSLRHTFASHLIMAGVPLLTVSRLLGHSSVEMTMRYAHLEPERLAWAIDKLGEWLDSSPSSPVT